MANRIKIDLERIVGAIDPNIYGGFAEHLGRCIYGGVYDPGSPLSDADGLRRDVLSALKRLAMPVMRYPGGNFVSGYRWRDGVGPKDDRPARMELAWHDIEPNSFGTNEFVAFCRRLGTEPYLAVNVGDGDMREARDWLEYCNGTKDTALVKLRQRHGYERPHNVRYWGIGNEVDGPWQIGMKTPDEYARAFTEYAKVMKWTDPSIKLVASAVSVWDRHWVERTQLLVEQAGRLIDYLALHWYVGNNTERGFADDDYASYMAISEQMEDRLSGYEGLLRALQVANAMAELIPIAVDEWNVWYRTGNEEKLEEVYNLEDALAVAMHFNAFFRHARTVKMANLAQIVNVIAPIVTRADGLLLQTTFFPFEVIRRTAGSVALDVHWSGDTFSSVRSPALRTLDVSATLDAKAKRLALFVVNRSPDEEMTAEIRLDAGRFAGPVAVEVINGPDVKSVNSFEHPDVVGVRDATLRASGTRFETSFEPHSVTALSFELA
jgi:alpha-L-arabinofuranosidase